MGLEGKVKLVAADVEQFLAGDIQFLGEYVNAQGECFAFCFLRGAGLFRRLGCLGFFRVAGLAILRLAASASSPASPSSAFAAAFGGRKSFGMAV